MDLLNARKARQCSRAGACGATFAGVACVSARAAPATGFRDWSSTRAGRLRTADEVRRPLSPAGLERCLPLARSEAAPPQPQHATQSTDSSISTATAASGTDRAANRRGSSRPSIAERFDPKALLLRRPLGWCSERRILRPEKSSHARHLPRARDSPSYPSRNVREPAHRIASIPQPTGRGRWLYEKIRRRAAAVKVGFHSRL